MLIILTDCTNRNYRLGLGDWVPVKSKTPRIYFTAYFYADALISGKSSSIVWEQAILKIFTLADKIKKAFTEKYLNVETGMYGSGLQTELSAALFWGLVPEEMKPKVAENLSARVIADDAHIDVGLLGTKTILNALSENGYSDLAYKVAAQETFPSWGWWIVNGATTFYENWPLDAAKDISMNHIMFGEISAWYYKALGGIFPDEEQPGFKNVILKPNFVEGLEHFEASYNGPYGTIISSWKKTGEGIVYTVTIPANSSATFYTGATEITENGKDLADNQHIKVEGGESQMKKIDLKAGIYEFLIKR
jgi:alpha-L-rhamnosidase